MRFSAVSATLLAVASLASADTTPGFDAISSPTQGTVMTAGSSFQIVWAPESVTGTVTITLLEGTDSSHLSAGPVVAASIDNQAGTYDWSIPADVGDFATYGFMITLDTNTTKYQYSYPFKIDGSTGASSDTSSVSATATSTTTIKITQATLTSTLSVTSVNASATAVSNSTIQTSSASSNVSTTLSKSTATATKTSGSSSTTSSSSTSSKSSSAAIANVASGGLAMIGGLVIAFAL